MSPLLPGTTIGILGGGQLGRMLTQAAQEMGYRVVSWIGGPDTGPASVADFVIEGEFTCLDALNEFLDRVDVATVEFENIPRSLLEKVAAQVPLHPNVEAVATCQHREREKAFLTEHQFPCADFWVIDSAESLKQAQASLGPNGGILKTAEFGYDGKGQLSICQEDEADAVWTSFNTPRAVLEEKIDLRAELSVLVARDQTGGVAVYDPAENVHRNHILDVSIVPARFDGPLLREAETIACGIATALDYVGIMAVEFFVSQDGRLLVNEMAPRPHNSGHHTIDACETSQFQQQLRAICGLALGAPRLHSPTVMLNLLGDVWEDNAGKPDWESILELPGSHLHLYGKQSVRRGRKMGHLTFTAATLDEALALQAKAREILSLPELEDSH